jgi:hypothetical protein
MIKLERLMRRLLVILGTSGFAIEDGEHDMAICRSITAFALPMLAACRLENVWWIRKIPRREIYGIRKALPSE